VYAVGLHYNNYYYKSTAISPYVGYISSSFLTEL